MINRKEFRAMGCRMSVLLDADESDARLLEVVPGWFEEWEQTLSRFRPDSELSRLNRGAGGWQPASAIFLEALQLALEMERRSNGLVTPTVLEALETAGYTMPFEPGFTISTGVPAFPQFSLDGTTGLQIDTNRQEIYLPIGMRLDLGGTAKGWAAHQTMQRLSYYGPVLVNAGGDISISGPHIDGSPWQVGIVDPLRPDNDLAVLSINSGGVATSGKDYRRWLKNGELFHHIIDPRTGEPAQTDMLTCTVYAPTVMEAESSAKELFILGSIEGEEWLLEHPETAALQVMDDGSVRVTGTMKQYVWRNNDTTNRSI